LLRKGETKIKKSCRNGKSSEYILDWLVRKLKLKITEHKFIFEVQSQELGKSGKTFTREKQNCWNDAEEDILENEWK
jgi:disulfide oxidoreductase YuzD